MQLRVKPQRVSMVPLFHFMGVISWQCFGGLEIWGQENM